MISSIIMLITTNLIFPIVTSTSSENPDPDNVCEQMKNLPETRGSNRAVPLNRQGLGFTEISTGLPTSGYYSYIVYGDFNKDNKIDIVFTGDNYNAAGNNAKGVYAYTGNGGTSWTDASTGLATYDSWAGCMVGDADADGYIEAYAANGAWGTSSNKGLKVWEYRNRNWNDSATHVTTPRPTGAPYNGFLANITGNSRLDLVLCNNVGIKYFQNNGGNPVTWLERSGGLSTSNQFTAVDVADMNKDGLKDIIASDYSGNEHMYIQNTTGNLWTEYSTGVAIPGTYLGIEVGDVNNDSHMDIVYGGNGAGLKCQLGNSGGAGGTSFSWTAANTGLPPNRYYYQIQICDIDLDGDLDIIAPRSYTDNAGIEIYLGNGSTNPGMNLGWTKAANINLTTTGDWTGVNCPDINSDGSPDIVAVSYGNGVKAWRNNLSQDITAPGAVTDLTITNVTMTNITISWSAPCDNGTDTLSGPVKGYDIRYYTSMINSGTWDTASECDAEPLPAAPGTQQTFTISELLPGTKYYIALKSSDERPNISLLSNVVFNTTMGIPDTTPPGKIYDLSAIDPTNNSINLTWTAPADNRSNASSGPVTEYDIRYHTTQITNITWPLAIKCTIPITPGQPGAAELYQVSGIQSDTVYYFSIKACDETNNLAWLSNCAFNTTLPTPDISPPAAITDLVAHKPTTTSINLTWSAVGDDGNSGNASNYDIRFATETITALTWLDAAKCSEIPTPSAPGNTEHYKVTDLLPDTIYYFVIIAGDETPLWSDLSNIAFNTTLPVLDTIPPNRIDDLAMVGTTGSSTKLTWSAPGDDGDVGTAASYDLRYSNVSISQQNGVSAIKIQEPPAPKAAGETETYNVTGLSASTKYYFAIRAVDDSENWSPISNSPSGTTLDDPKPTLIMNLTPEKTELTSGETIDLRISVVTRDTQPHTPVPLADIKITTDNSDLSVIPVTGQSDQNGILNVKITAPVVADITEITIFANANKTNFASDQGQVMITVQPEISKLMQFDLHITDKNISLSKTEITEGNEIIFYANIHNIGAIDAAEFNVSFFLDNEQLGSPVSYQDLNMGNHVNATQAWSAKKGNFTLRIEITPLNFDLEANIQDNSAEIEFSVHGKDEGGEKTGKTQGSSFMVFGLIILVCVIIIILIFCYILLRRKNISHLNKYEDTRISQEPHTLSTSFDSEIQPQTTTLTMPSPAPPTTPLSVLMARPVDILPQNTVKESEATGETVIDKPPMAPLALPVSTGEPETPEPEGETNIQQVPCPTCKNQISVYSSPCIHCGTNMNWNLKL